MNRIYQGRVSRVEIRGADGKWVPLDRWQEILWHHHELFQDAVNYYIVALAAMGNSAQSKLTLLRGLLGRVWGSFDRKGQSRPGMGESLQRAWKLPEPPTLEAAIERFRSPLSGNGVTEIEMELAGESLAFDLGGEGSIQQGGSEYWPYFCQSGFKRGVTFPRESAQLAKEKAARQIPRLIWHPKAEAHVARIHRALGQSHFCNTATNGKTLPAGRAKEIFQAALKTLKSAGHINAREYDLFVAELGTGCTDVKEYAGGSINKKALKERFYGFLVFKHLAPGPAGLEVLRNTYPRPKEKKHPGRVASQGPKEIEGRLLSLKEDPIKLVRAKAGIVFRAFTALPIWQCSSSGDELHERSEYAHEVSAGERHHVAWKHFDVAAFKEALKVYNQFQQNVGKREERLKILALKLLVMDGSRAADSYSGAGEPERAIGERLGDLWRACKGKPKLPTNEAGEEVAMPRFDGDPRIDRLRTIVSADLAEEYHLTDGHLTPYGLRRRTVKGWGEIKRRWRQVVKAGESFSQEKRRRLQDVLDELRGGEKREQIGSHRLFEALIADEQAWLIWREPDDEFQDRINKNQWAADPLDAFREYCETREALEEISNRPLNFAPADARYSRRLFMFTDACSFGAEDGEFKHEATALAVTVPVALRDTGGSVAMQPCRLTYSAPRLVRDGIRSEHGHYLQDWAQPMMRALLGEAHSPCSQPKLRGAAVQLMPDYDSKGGRRFLLNFPLNLNEKPLQDRIGKAGLWEKQFVSWKKGSPFRFIRWDREFDGKEPHRWWDKVSCFRVLAADLGTRHAAGAVIVECGTAQEGCSRPIGSVGGKDWHARYRSGAILRLPGENAGEVRPESPLDRDGRGRAPREELYGGRGRFADDAECEETFSILSALGQRDLLKDVPDLASLKQRFSFPEQNDKLLVAFRLAQKWIAICASWQWKLTQAGTEQQRQSALGQIREHGRVPEWHGLADGDESHLARLQERLREHITDQRDQIRRGLLRLTERILPVRRRTWEWVDRPERPGCHLLRQTQEGTGPGKVKLRGQRGLSMARIGQLSDLRRRWQSFNQSLRIEIGARPRTASEMRNDPIPDPCPDILNKLENIREQRVNQTAHMILAQALGLRLRRPRLSRDRRQAAEIHGEYEAFRNPVDMIVLEDLARYLADQGRPKTENTRLMKWCHRAITGKLKMLAEPFGIPVLETPAAYSSRFCSLSGAAGFRAAEVSLNDRHKFRWRVLLEEEAKARAEKGEPSSNAGHAARLFALLATVTGSGRPNRTLLAPQPGGPMFLTAKPIPHPAPAANRRQGNDGAILPMQADLNAAINLALRAVAHPAAAHIHHRLRTERKKGEKGQADIFLAKEPRRFGKEKVPIYIREGDSFPKERNTNLFFDAYWIARFGRAGVKADPQGQYDYASGPAIWKTVNDRDQQWRRCMAINAARLRAWGLEPPKEWEA